MFCTWYSDVVLMALGALVTAWLIQHLCHRRSFGTDLRFSGWVVGVGLIAVGGLILGQSFDAEWAARSCSQFDFIGQTLVRLTLVGRLLVWSALYAAALAACWLVYRLVAPRQRVAP
jgi:hypothetical protein